MSLPPRPGEGGLCLAFRGRLGRFALDVAFSAPGRGVTALFGPSGCGKTTVLRCAAGLQTFADGYCAVDGEVWQDGAVARPTYRRPVGYVFQEPSLSPHLSVRKNLLFAAGSGAPPGWDEVLELLGLGALLDRSPRMLSGGERQRVAIGRALLSRPKLLLMDEPVSALDRSARDEILAYLERLCATLAIPILYVTHDMAEVERLAAHLVLLREGRVLGAGALADLQSDPALPLARAREAAVSLEGVVTGYDATFGLATLAVRGGSLAVPALALEPGTARRLRIAAIDVSLAREHPGRSTILNVLPARVKTVFAAAPHEITAVLTLGSSDDGTRLLSRVTRKSWEALGFRQGEDVFVQVKAIALEGRDVRPAWPRA